MNVFWQLPEHMILLQAVLKVTQCPKNNKEAKLYPFSCFFYVFWCTIFADVIKLMYARFMDMPSQVKTGTILWPFILSYLDYNKPVSINMICLFTDNNTQQPSDAPVTSDPGLRPLEGETCLTDDGRLWEEGQSWHDGCRLCFCHQAREMCTLITCPVPRCRHPIIRHADCCASCAG